MATKKTAKKTATKTAPKTTAKKKTPTKKPAAKPASSKLASTSTTLTTADLAAMLEGCPEAVEVKIPEENGIAVRLRTRQLELPLLVHMGELVVFDLYPFRFVGVDAARVDWARIIRLCRTGYVQLGLDNDFDDEDVLVYSFHIPLKSLDDETLQTVVATLTGFAEDNYDDVMAATGLVQKKTIKH